MPKMDGLDKSIRIAMLKDELSDGAEPTDIPITPAPLPVAEPAPLVPPAVAAMETAALIQMLAAALNQNGLAQATAIKDALASATTMARTPIPENQVDPGISVYSAPGGDQAQPRTELRCPMFLGVYDEDGKVIPAFEIFEDTCTEKERVLLNQVKPGTYRVTRNDEEEADWMVAEKIDGLGQPIRLVIAVPFTWLHKDQFQQMPSQTRFLQQLTA